MAIDEQPRAAISPTRSAPRATPPGRSPLRAVLSFTFLNSLGTGAVTSGLYFLTAQAYGFGPTRNFLLGLVLGLVYVAGALAAGPIMRRLGRRDSVSARTVVVILMIVLAATCAIPWAAERVRSPAPEWSAWVFGLIYIPLTGVLWPIIESFLSGGRRRVELSRATGRFNVVWSAALVVSYWAMAPLLETGPLLVLVGLGVMHLIAIGPAWAMGRSPGAHMDTHDDHAPASYTQLRRVFRVLLPMSYVALATVTPFLPAAMDRLGIATAWQTPLASVWLTARVFVFLVFERWHGWHGKRWIPWVAMAGLVAGFAAIVIAPQLAGPEAGAGAGAGTGAGVGFGVWVLAAGLAVFGASQAIIYLGALYYALELGAGGVDAGGWHEALIGMGYAVGPGLGLVISLVLGVDHPMFAPVLIGCVGLSLVAATVTAAVGGRK